MRRIRPGQRGGVGVRGAHPGLGAAHLRHDDRHAPIRRQRGRAAEGGDVLDALDIGQQDVGLAGADQVLGQGEAVEHRLVAGADDMREAELARPAAVVEGEADAARWVSTLMRLPFVVSGARDCAKFSTAGLKVATIRAAVLKKPSAFGPTTAMSCARAAAWMRAWRALPPSPASSAKPELMM